MINLETTLKELNEIIPKDIGLMLVHTGEGFQCTLYSRGGKYHFTAVDSDIPKAIDEALKGFKDKYAKELETWTL